MSLAEQIRALQGICPACEWYQTLSAEERKEFDTYVKIGGNMAALYRLCAENGLDMSQYHAPVNAFREHCRYHHGKYVARTAVVHRDPSK